MIRLRNADTGVVVKVDVESARSLGPEWAPVDPEPEKPARRRAAK